MTIPKLTPYTGQVANPDGSQTQTEFTQNMFDQLSYEAQLATQLDATIDGMNNAVDEVEANAVSAENSANAAEAAANFEGEFTAGVTSAIKGKSYLYNNEIWLCLQNTTATPATSNADWKLSIGEQYIAEITDPIIANIANHESRISSNETDIANLFDGQQSGVIVFQTYALLDAYTPANATEEKGSFKVTQDPDPSLNGYYSWVSGTTYTKDADLVVNSIDEANTSDAVSGKAVYDYARPREALINSKDVTFTEGFIAFVDETDPEYGEAGYFSGKGLVGLESYKHTGKISVEPGDVFIVTGSDAHWAYFNKDKEQIWSFPNSNDPVTVPETFYGEVPAYLSLASSNAKIDSGLLWGGYGSELPSVKPDFGTEIAAFSNEGILNQIHNIGKESAYSALKRQNSVTPEAISITSGFYMALDRGDPEYGQQGYVGSIGIVDNPAYKMTQFIPTTAGITFILNDKFNTSHIGYFDDNKQWIGSIPKVDNTPVVTPEIINGKRPSYIRVGATLTQMDEVCIIGYGTSIPANFDPLSPFATTYSQIIDAGILKQIAEGTNNLTGKKWVAFGDSITAAVDSYAYKITAEQGMTRDNPTNFAVSGGRIGNDGTGSFIMSDHVDDVPLDTDIITIAGGTNDTDNVDNTYLGSMSDRANTTFYGACHVLFSGVLERCPSAKVGVITPIPRGDVDQAETDWQKAKVQAIKEVAEYYAIPLLDAHTNSHGLTPRIASRRTAYMPDGLHPNSDGHAIYAGFVSRWMNDL